jgi:site-specific DNA-methyltransferase (adenine-specific)
MVTDPPAGIGFMGLAFDSARGGRDKWIAWLSSILKECYRVLKPGAHILVWALPRTSHWTATAIEDAGFTLRDEVTHFFHLFGSGFPKSLNLKEGRGTALKPAVEFWILARKKVEGTLTVNVSQWGTGAINIEGCRLDANRPKRSGLAWDGLQTKVGPIGHSTTRDDSADALGRWPAHLILSHSDGCSKVHKHVTEAKPKGAFSFGKKQDVGYEVTADEDIWMCVPGCPIQTVDCQGYGPVSTYFYVPKPDRRERDIGCGFFEQKTGGEMTRRKEGSAGTRSPRAGAGRISGGQNNHPTVKSIELMRWLCRLTTPPGGRTLDPFCGSGSTGCAALREGFLFLGMEQDPSYARLARARIGYVARYG